MNRQQRLIQLIEDALNPELVRVENNSDLHQGHLGDDGTGETHFKIEITCKRLKKLSRIDAQRAVNKVIKDEFENGLHALEIRIF